MNKVKAPSADSGQDRTTFVGALVPLPIKQLPKREHIGPAWSIERAAMACMFAYSVD